MKKLCQLSFVLAVLCTAAPSQAQMDMQRRNAPVFCGQNNFQVCGVGFTVPPGSLGNIQSMPMPDRFVIPQVTFQCISDGLNVFYQIMNQDVMNCAMKTCAPGSVTICGNNIAIEKTATFGNLLSVKLNDKLIDRTRSSASPAITVQCGADKDGTKFMIVNNGGISSCDIFMCEPAKLEVCDSAVDIQDYLPMGTALDVMTENNQPVHVQCIGSLEGAPHYVVTDHSCN